MTRRTRNSDTSAAAVGTRRRDVLIGAAGLGVGAIAAVGVQQTVEATRAPATFGTDLTAPVGDYQPGIASAEAAHAALIGLDLAPGIGRDRLAALLRLLTDDADRLMAGAAPVADQEPELAALPANLAVHIGFGPELVDRVDPLARPEWLAPLPPLPIDRLEERFSGGDLLLHLTSDDPLALAHARRMLQKDARAFTSVRWVQAGFRNAHRALDGATTQRNLFGQIDGTVNPAAGTADVDAVIRIDGSTGRGGDSPSWLAGGTSFVLRRIRLDLETWDEVDRPGREASIGRRLDTGAPLTGVHEHDEPDFEARTAQGFTVIHPMSHMRRARGSERILRRTYNYDDPVVGAAGMGAAISDAGLLFGAYQANPRTQFLPIQQRLAEGDLLNTWTTPIGSSVFAVPPRPAAGGFIGEGLFA